MTTSRMTFTLLLATSLAFALGCGSKAQPEQPNTPSENNPTPSDPNTGTPPVESPKIAYELDQTKHVIPTTPVRGSIAGLDVTPSVVIQGTELTFNVFKTNTREVERCIRLNLAPMIVAGQQQPSVLDRKWEVKLDVEPGPNIPHGLVEAPGANKQFIPSQYAMTLELGQRKDDKVPGKIYLCLKDDPKTLLAGTFTAEYTRSIAERPGKEDVPYIGGEVTVVGAKPDAEVGIGYAAFTAAGVNFQELTLVFDPPSETAVLSKSSESTTFVRGEKKGEPFRYEHVKLKPGRYLVSAAVIGGPTAWKWVDVAEGAALTENFTVDAAKTGGVEVSVPADVTGKVYVVPADDSSRPAIDTEVFRAVSVQVLRQEIGILAGKALIKNLGPGKYEVRVGDLKGHVEIVAGKTAELMLAPPKK